MIIAVLVGLVFFLLAVIVYMLNQFQHLTYPKTCINKVTQVEGDVVKLLVKTDLDELEEWRLSDVDFNV